MKSIKLWLMVALLSAVVGSLLIFQPTGVHAEAQAQACSQDGLHFFNNAGETVWVAVNYYDNAENDFVSLGWWRIESSQTLTALSGPLQDVFYYYYAVGQNTVWNGGADGWVDFNSSWFRIPDYFSRGFALGQGFTDPGFREIFVGNCFGYTLELVR